MNARQPANDHLILDDAMSGDGDRIHKDDIIADLTIMRDMTVRHEQAVISDPRDAATAIGARLHGHIFADAVARADFQPCMLTFEFQILRIVTDGRKGIYDRLGSNRGIACHDDMGFKLCPVAKTHIRTDQTERADTDALPDLSPLLDNC